MRCTYDGFMPNDGRSSRSRFGRYLIQRRARDRAAEGRAVHPELTPTGTAPGDDAANRSARKSTRRNRSFLVLARAIWGLLRGHHAVVIASIATLSVSMGMRLISPASTKVAFDYILMDSPGPVGLPGWLPVPVGERFASLAPADQAGARVSLMWLLGGSLMVLILIDVSVGMWGRWHMTRLTKRLQANLRRRVFAHAVRLPLHRIHQLKTGGAASLLREDAGSAAELLFSLVYNPWRAIIQLVGALAVLVAVDYRLLLMALAVLPCVWYSERLWLKRLRPVFRDIHFSRQTIDSRVTEAFAGMRVVRAFSRQRGETSRFINDSHLMARQEILAWWWSRVLEVIWMILLPTASVAVLIYGGSQVVNGRLTIGDVVLFMSYMLMLLGPLEALSTSATSIQTQLAALDRILDLLEEPTEFRGAAVVADEPGAGGADGERGALIRLPASFPGRITFDSVSFTYPGQAAPVLEDISLEALPGTTVALVGPSGAGKTTICNLVARFYDPTRGRVLLDGVDLRRIHPDDYRRCLGVVEQDVFLFDGSVAENIAYSRRGAAFGAIREAAQAANADGFIAELDRGYDTMVGERGVRLSGGQKQRIAIARALLADPRILILDEATSNLDSESEQLIQRSLAMLLRGRTSFVIAHRLSTIRHADLIVVIDHGRIIETGTHDELLDAGGRYADMLRIQLQHQPVQLLREGGDRPE